jgi:hypothetical protein
MTVPLPSSEAPAPKLRILPPPPPRSVAETGLDEGFLSICW